MTTQAVVLAYTPKCYPCRSQSQSLIIAPMSGVVKMWSAAIIRLDTSAQPRVGGLGHLHVMWTFGRTAHLRPPRASQVSRLSARPGWPPGEISDVDTRPYLPRSRGLAPTPAPRSATSPPQRRSAGRPKGHHRPADAPDPSAYPRSGEPPPARSRFSASRRSRICSSPRSCGQP